MSARREAPVRQMSRGSGSVYSSWVRWAGQTNTHMAANRDGAPRARCAEATPGGPRVKPSPRVRRVWKVRGEPGLAGRATARGWAGACWWCRGCQTRRVGTDRLPPGTQLADRRTRWAAGLRGRPQLTDGGAQSRGSAGARLRVPGGGTSGLDVPWGRDGGRAVVLTWEARSFPEMSAGGRSRVASAGLPGPSGVPSERAAAGLLSALMGSCPDGAREAPWKPQEERAGRRPLWSCCGSSSPTAWRDVAVQATPEQWGRAPSRVWPHSRLHAGAPCTGLSPFRPASSASLSRRGTPGCSTQSSVRTQTQARVGFDFCWKEV